MTQAIDWFAIAAPLCLVGGALVALLGDAFLPRWSMWLPAAASVGALGAALAFTIALRDEAGDGARVAFCLPGEPGQPGACSWVVDSATTVWWIVIVGATALVVLMLRQGVTSGDIPPGELHFLLLCSATGALVVAASGDLITLLIGMETVSLPAFALVGLRRHDRHGAEAALKFFIASVVATAFTLLGISMVYGATGSVAAGPVAAAAAVGGDLAAVLAMGMILTVVGLAFKVAAVPFQAWVPDTYVGAPIPIAAYLSVVSKAAGLAGIVVVLFRFFGPLVDTWSPIVAVVAAVTMTLGNLAALRQRHAVRLLAWSSVAQAGYLLVPIAAGGSDVDVAALQAYVAMYAIVNLSAFGVAAAAGAWGAVTVDDFTGLVRTHPWLGAGLGFALLCLAGLPPGVVGLVAKVVIFTSAVEGDLMWLAIVMAVNVAIGLVYYLRFLVALLQPVPEGSVEAGEGGVPSGAGVVVVRPPDVPWSTEFAVGVTLAAAVVLSVFPGILFGPIFS